jgi:hypothetical protein
MSTVSQYTIAVQTVVRPRYVVQTVVRPYYVVELLHKAGHGKTLRLGQRSNIACFPFTYTDSPQIKCPHSTHFIGQFKLLFIYFYTEKAYCVYFLFYYIYIRILSKRKKDCLPTYLLGTLRGDRVG